MFLLHLFEPTKMRSINGRVRLRVLRNHAVAGPMRDRLGPTFVWNLTPRRQGASVRSGKPEFSSSWTPLVNGTIFLLHFLEDAQRLVWCN